jgi:AcrR family transcriptional regulator
MDQIRHTTDGHQKRREATRERLIAAAKSVMSETQVEAVSIDDIIQKAAVGKGSFYNHFKTKEELFYVTLDGIVADLTRQVRTVVRELDDPAEILSVGIQLHIKYAMTDPEIGRFIVNAPASLDMFKRYADPVVHRTIEAGIKSGRFNIQNRRLFFIMMTSSTNATLLGLLERQFEDSVATELATAVLLLAGLSAEEARQVACRPLPEGDYQRNSTMRNMS